MRTHVVLVPGFGGFDALGQLNYYNGVTEALATWKRDHGSELSLHYFDNLPSAAVQTRAKRLRRYLTKLVQREVIQGNDRIVLGGHSTGGLDIRQLLRDLEADGDTRVLPRIRRLAFMSVPHRGTNIADWVRNHATSRQLLVGAFRQAVGLGIGVPRSVLGAFGLAAPGTSQLFDAVDDVRCDFEPRDPDDALDQADARRAKAEVNLWLDDTDHDFLAIDDLMAAARDPKRLAESIADDVALWKKRDIVPRSYATVATPLPGALDDSSQRSIPAILLALRHNVPDTDAVFRVAYTACVGGPFVAGKQPDATWLVGGAKLDPFEDGQNDGIVNTASMLLDYGTNHVVSGDHADIIGHYKPVLNEEPHKEGPLPGRRKFRAYDLLGSASGFTDDTFRAVWNDVFAFAAA